MTDRKNHGEWAFTRSMQDVLRDEIGRPDGFAPGSADACRAEIRRMEPEERRELRKAIRSYRRASLENADRLEREVNSAVFRGAKGGLRVLARGAALGVSAAGVVNTVAPGLFSTTLGYVAGAAKGTGFMNVLTRLGLVSVGVFAPPVISQGAILLFGAAFGVVVYGVWRALRGIARAIVRR